MWSAQGYAHIVSFAFPLTWWGKLCWKSRAALLQALLHLSVLPYHEVLKVGTWGGREIFRLRCHMPMWVTMISFWCGRLKPGRLDSGKDQQRGSRSNRVVKVNRLNAKAICCKQRRRGKEAFFGAHSCILPLRAFVKCTACLFCLWTV